MLWKVKNFFSFFVLLELDWEEGEGSFSDFFESFYFSRIPTPFENSSVCSRLRVLQMTSARVCVRLTVPWLCMPLFLCSGSSSESSRGSATCLHLRHRLVIWFALSFFKKKFEKTLFTLFLPWWDWTFLLRSVLLLFWELYITYITVIYVPL